MILYDQLLSQLTNETFIKPSTNSEKLKHQLKHFKLTHTMPYTENGHGFEPWKKIWVMVLVPDHF